MYLSVMESQQEVLESRKKQARRILRAYNVGFLNI